MTGPADAPGGSFPCGWFSVAPPNPRLLLVGVNGLMELVVVRLTAHAVRTSGRLAGARVARSGNAERYTDSARSCTGLGGAMSYHPTSEEGEKMGTASVNGVRLFYQLSGTGEVPLVLVHGSWDSCQDWGLLVPSLADSFRVVTYDRRGHSSSERPSGQGSVREDVADLAGLIEHLGLAPAWVAGNSFGASIALRLAAERPELLRGLIGHEPPLLSLIADDPAVAPMLEEVGKRIDAVAERIAAGDHAGAAEQFVEEVALGPGMWAQLPPESRQIMIENAPTFLDEYRDPEQLGFDLERVRGFAKPALLTLGGESPPLFASVVSKLVEALASAEVVTLPDAGHIPHVTHPDAYAEMIIDLTSKQTA